MPKFNKDEFTSEIEEVIGVLKENDKNDWVKAVARISWNGNPATLDIRNINMAKNDPKKGISLSDEEADRLVDILLEHDYGSLESLNKAVDKKKSRFTVKAPVNDTYFDDGPLYVNLDL